MKNIYLKNINDITIHDSSEIGLLSNSLAELKHCLLADDFSLPKGFVITNSAYQYFKTYNNLYEKVNSILIQGKPTDSTSKHLIYNQIKVLYIEAQFPNDLKQLITQEYLRFLGQNKAHPYVAIKLYSFDKLKTTKHPNYLNINLETSLFESIKLCFANGHADHSIHNNSSKSSSKIEGTISVLIQEMIQSDVGESGTAFSVKQKHGFENLIEVNANYGIGNLVKNKDVQPDEFLIHKPTITNGLRSIFSKELGSKETLTMFDKENNKITKQTPTPMRERFSIDDLTALKIAKQIVFIEQYYKEKHGTNITFSVEWALDGPNQKLYIIDIYPQIIKHQKTRNKFSNYNQSFNQIFKSSKKTTV